MKEKQRDMGQRENVQPTSNQNSRKLIREQWKGTHEIMAENMEDTTAKIREDQ